VNVNMLCAGMVVVINGEFNGSLVVAVEGGRRGGKQKQLEK
jgi:hypothetical protein